MVKSNNGLPITQLFFLEKDTLARSNDSVISTNPPKPLPSFGQPAAIAIGPQPGFLQQLSNPLLASPSRRQQSQTFLTMSPSGRHRILPSNPHEILVRKLNESVAHESQVSPSASQHGL